MPAAHQRFRTAGSVLRLMGVPLAAALGVMRTAARPHRAAVARLWDIPLTVIGAACVDTGVFRASTVAGWIVTGASLVAVEFLIADGPGGV